MLATSPMTLRLGFATKRSALLFQQFNLLPRTTALKQVALPLMYGGTGRSERFERAEQALISVGLGDRIDHKPDELSGGQQQRVAIARALATQPSILLADEPTGALDTTSGEEILRIFEQLNADGITVIMVTHDLDVANRAKRVIRLSDGVVISDESTTQPAPSANGATSPAIIANPA